LSSSKTEDDEGLLEYLEDIIGSNKFIEQANEEAALVEALTEQWQERLIRVKALGKEKVWKGLNWKLMFCSVKGVIFQGRRTF
jgi:hypothetical protein